MCGEFCCLTVLPFYFEETLQLSPDVFGLYLSGAISLSLIGTFLSDRSVKIIGMTQTIGVGLVCSFAASVGLFLTMVFLPTSPLSIMASIAMYCLGSSMIWGPSSSRALQCFEDKRGAASAVRALLIVGMSALGGFAGSFLDASTLMPLSLFLLALTVGCGALFQGLKKLERPA